MWLKFQALVHVAVNLLSGNSETIEDLRRLCVVFEHVEKLLTLAASLHRKFLQAPRIAEAIFSDYYNFYLPTMGVGSADVDVQKIDAEKVNSLNAVLSYSILAD